MVHLGISQQQNNTLGEGMAGFLAGTELFLFTFFIPIIVLCVEQAHRTCRNGCRTWWKGEKKKLDGVLS